MKSGGGLLPGIQLLRGWAALLVVISHANGMMRYPEYFGQSPFALPDIGSFGVAIFFVISGFIITIVSLDGALSPRLSIGEYARRRFIRIVPFLWLAIIGYNLFTYIGTREVEWLPALRALAVWPVGELKPNVIWSLRHEFLFYALFAISLMGARRKPWLLIGWLAAPIVIWSALLPFDPRSTPWHPYNFELARVVLLGSETGANVQFGTGILLAILWLKRDAAMRDRLPMGFSLASIATVAATAVVIALALPPGLGRILLWTGLATTVVGLGIVARPESVLFRTVGLVLGNASFSIYLVHNPALLTLLEASRPIKSVMPPTAFLAAAVLLATLVGVAVHYLVEMPLIEALSGKRRFFLRPRAASW